MGLVPLEKLKESLLALFALHHVEVDSLQLGRGLLPEPSHADILISDFQPPEL